MDQGANIFSFNLPEPVRIKQYVPISSSIDYSHPNYLYEGNKYRSFRETEEIFLDQKISTLLYTECFKQNLANKQTNMMECYKQKLTVFRQIISVLRAEKKIVSM